MGRGNCQCYLVWVLDQWSMSPPSITTDKYYEPRVSQQSPMNGRRKGRSSATAVPSPSEVWGRHQSARMIPRESSLWHQWGKQQCWYFVYRGRLPLFPLVSMIFTIATTIITVVNCLSFRVVPSQTQSSAWYDWALISVQVPKRQRKRSTANSCSASAICEASRLFCMLSAASLFHLSLTSWRKTKNYKRET